MRIVDFETFVKLPAGTIFAPIINESFNALGDRLSIKADIGRMGKYGWWFNGVMPLEPWDVEIAFYNDSIKATFEIYDGDNNDYRDYKHFLIFDTCDIDRMIKVLEWAKSGCSDDKYEAFDEE